MHQPRRHQTHRQADCSSYQRLYCPQGLSPLGLSQLLFDHSNEIDPVTGSVLRVNATQRHRLTAIDRVHRLPAVRLVTRATVNRGSRLHSQWLA